MIRTIDPIITTERLQGQLSAGDLKIIDIRFEEEYAAGHIPGAISVPFGLVSAWADSDDELILELPADEDLFKVVGSCGLTGESKVVIVGRVEAPPAPPYPLADAVRVAVTLIYAGIGNVAVLAGGHPKWEREGRATTTEIPQVEVTAYRGSVDRESWVSTEYVKDHIGEAVIIDGRDPDQYFGTSIDPFTDMCGHIPTARSLPLVWVWEKDGTYRPNELIEGMATGVIGEDRSQEIIAYCGVGGYASTWWFLLTQLLGYTNVKIYDGSMEAWAEGGNPLVRYSWTQ
ncbi:MAG: rhodanese-like domain-containing protein [Actinobacteria bacterium]|nr:rhodanese-like domain-containing protein [Actinomycetota bacterium]